MDESEKTTPKGCSRREALKLSTLALGGLAMGGRMLGAGGIRDTDPCPAVPACYPDTVDSNQAYSYFFGGNGQPGVQTYNPLDATDPNTPIQPNEMRIVFLGSCIPPNRRAQMEMSIYVEVGTGGGTAGIGDSFVFDCGSGVCVNYGAMGIPYSKMNKVFITHLHGDHMSDLTHIYCFGAAADRKKPLYVWGPSRSGVKNPKAPPETYEDGHNDMCKAYRKAWRWHSESMSFIQTKDPNYVPPTKKTWGLPCDPVPLEGDSPRDGYALVPIQLDWTKRGKHTDDNVAYHNKDTGVKITHFPVIHCRQGSIGYKLEWNGMSMIYTSDTKPEVNSIDQAINGGRGVDVFIHEMVVPPDVWAFKQMGLTQPPDQQTQPELYAQWQQGTEMAKTVQDSSHTPQGAFAYLLTQINPHPRLTVATHFPVEDDTWACAKNSLLDKCPWIVVDPQVGNMVWSFDLMTLRVMPGTGLIKQLRGVVSDYGFGAPGQSPSPLDPAKYHNNDATKSDDPTKQLDQTQHDTWIPPSDGNICHYREDGY